MEEWRHLTSLYAEMGDVEIRELADQIGDLTETAQQVLRDEMKKRGIVPERKPIARGADDLDRGEEAEMHLEPSNYTYHFSPLPNEEDGPHTYTWKVPLCTCENTDQAWQLGQALKRRGIDSWLETPQRGGRDLPRILVGADQLESAKMVAAEPVPQDIVDELNEMKDDRNDYDLPVCPKCKAEDPTLESVEPSNNWLCEACGYTWSDPLPDSASPEV